MTNWTRHPNGTYQRLGWTIARARFSGSGQSRPFAHVNTKAYSAWMVTDPDGFLRSGGATLNGAKANADRQIQIRGYRLASCTCMVEPDEQGVERVLTHSSDCPEYLP